ncbi:putative DNA ligase [Chlamydiales bacterium STE3]|nr:putative DNA ligase [Chlamydiales bacterium STE3]
MTMHSLFTLIEDLDATTSTNEKIHKLSAYFKNCPPADGAWALFFLSGKRFKRFISSSKLKLWCQEEINIPSWLFNECISRVGDSAESISLLLPQENSKNRREESLAEWLEKHILPLRALPEEEQKKSILETWRTQTSFEKFVTNKILSGTFRIGVSFLLTIKGLSKAFDLPETLLNLRLTGNWEPSLTFFQNLTTNEIKDDPLHLRPYPFYLASPLDKSLEKLGSPDEWVAEWKWDGIRAQLLNQEGHPAIWSRGNELITHSFPELFNEQVAKASFILDGEILVLENERPRPFADLQKRLGRKKITASLIEQYPVFFMIYDILQWLGNDVRSLPYLERRLLLKEHESFFLGMPFWRISPMLHFQEWEEVKALREKANETKTEGLILKKKDSPYGVGRKRGSWWKFKIDSMTIDAVLIYAQPGSGYRSGLYTDYTFGVWNEGNELVPIAKAYSGLTQEEILAVDKWIRANTLEKFGPVRKVKPELVFEIAFENIQLSKRHKAGLALRFPRIKRWRHDKTPTMADPLEALHHLLKVKYL